MSFEMEKLKGKRPTPPSVPTGYVPAKTGRSKPAKKVKQKGM